ncbi:MAG: S49 family peptidase [Legionellales bacterium]
MNNDTSSQSSTDSHLVLNQILLELVRERKYQRIGRWIKRIIVLLILLGLVIYAFVSGDDEVGPNTKPHVGIVDISGEMSDAKGANADDFAMGMDGAYKNKGLKALILRINSPGGSPVQAEYMYNIVNYYKSKHPKIKMYAVCVDLCASAAYYVAVAADEIYASPASMVGSIGVLYNGFGFVDIIQKVGVTRRLQTAGVNKGFMDPFSPVTPSQTKKLQTMLDIVHQQFINRVKTGRGSRLLVDEDTFSGLFWTGEQAMAMGLIDGFASSGQLARDIIKVDSTIDYTHKQTVFDRVTKNLGTAMADELPLSFGFKPGLR